MKRLSLLLLTLALFLLAACEALPGQSSVGQPLQFYYCNVPAAETAGAYAGETGALRTQTWTANGTNPTVLQILNQYLQGTDAPDLQSPFPKDLTVKDCTLDSGVLTVTFDEKWMELTGFDRTMAEACLVHTMTQMPDVNAVRIRCRAGDDVLLTREQFLLLDDSATSDEVMVKLYFSDAGGRYLVEEQRVCLLKTQEETMTYVLEQLLAGSQVPGVLPVIPVGTELLNVELEQGICTVDFSGAFWEGRPKTHAEARMIVFSVVNSLTELPEVERVKFLCEGQPIGDYGGLDLAGTFIREEPALGQRSAASLDETLYLPCGAGHKLAAVPAYIRQETGRSRAHALMTALLDFSPANGYGNPLPIGTEMLGVQITGGLCEVSFNEAFAQCDTEAETAELAVRTVVTTLCGIEGVEEVLIRLPGGNLSFVDLTKPHSPETDWVLP